MAYKPQLLQRYDRAIGLNSKDELFIYGYNSASNPHFGEQLFKFMKEKCVNLENNIQQIKERQEKNQIKVLEERNQSKHHILQGKPKFVDEKEKTLVQSSRAKGYIECEKKLKSTLNGTFWMHPQNKKRKIKKSKKNYI